MSCLRCLKVPLNISFNQVHFLWNTTLRMSFLEPITSHLSWCPWRVKSLQRRNHQMTFPWHKRNQESVSNLGNGGQDRDKGKKVLLKLNEECFSLHSVANDQICVMIFSYHDNKDYREVIRAEKAIFFFFFFRHSHEILFYLFIYCIYFIF